MMKLVVFFWIRCLFFCLFSWGSIAGADEKSVRSFEPVFRVLSSGAVTTLDPQKSLVRTNRTVSAYLFDPLFTIKQGEPVPILVDSYKWLTPTRWEFSLKKGVLFHDGSELTSHDVVATFNRARRLKNTAYTYLKGKDITALDTYRFQVDTATPNSELLWGLGEIFVIKHTAEQADSDEFDQGGQLVGTGPYQLVERKNFEQLTLKAFMGYHRGAAYIRNVHFQTGLDEKQRVKAFSEGKAGLIDELTDNQLSTLRGKANITNLISSMLFSLVFDHRRDSSPDIRDNNGKLMQKNPLKDLRVRQAISKALDREKLIGDYYGEGSRAQAAGQLINNRNKNYSPVLKPDRQDLPAARQLLSEAGYPNGFQVTLRDKDSRRGLIELIASMLKKVKINVQVETLPASQFFPKALAGEFSMSHFGFTTDGNLAEMLKQLFYTSTEGNVSSYSNTKLDQQIDKAMAQTSTNRKRRELRKAQDMVIKDLAVIPIHFRMSYWAVRLDMVFLPTDQRYLEAYYVRPNE